MLFKYLSSERVDVLENLKIRFSPLMSLNDPFECQPLVDIRNERDQFLEETLRDLDELWEKTNASEKTEENRRVLEETRRELIVDVNSKLNSFVVGQELMSRLSDNFGVLSLSRTEENLLMWSHYADEGKGIVIGFNDDHDFLNSQILAEKILGQFQLFIQIKEEWLSLEKTDFMKNYSVKNHVIGHMKRKSGYLEHSCSNK